MARIEVPMPQMGESIVEGMVSKWLKRVGDWVDRDEPILEISTDKVDAEIPAPQAGVLSEVVVTEGETVAVGTIVAYIETNGAGSPVAQGSVALAATADAPTEDTPTHPVDRGNGGDAPRTELTPDEPTAEERFRQRATPVVRRMAEEHGVDLSALEGRGSGHGGRVTKQDLLEYLGDGGRDEETAEGHPAAAEHVRRTPPASAPSVATSAPAQSSPPGLAGPVGLPELWQAFYGGVQHPEFPVREGDEVATMDKIRRLTAEHMVLAKRIAPHVHSFIEIDFSRVDQVLREHQPRWREQGVRMRFTALIAWAVSRTVSEFPMLNATASGYNVIFRGNVNLGIAVDLDPGLIVPVIRDADDLSLVDIAKKIVDLAERARTCRLEPEEIQGGTFTITNPGVLGTLAGMPIIPKGTSGILGIGAIEKKVVVVSDPITHVDSIAIRKRSIFSLGYDHRIVDGADAARFLANLKQVLEEFPDDA